MDIFEECNYEGCRPQKCLHYNNKRTCYFGLPLPSVLSQPCANTFRFPHVEHSGGGGRHHLRPVEDDGGRTVRRAVTGRCRGRRYGRSIGIERSRWQAHGRDGRGGEEEGGICRYRSPCCSMCVVIEPQLQHVQTSTSFQ